MRLLESDFTNVQKVMKAIGIGMGSVYCSEIDMQLLITHNLPSYRTWWVDLDIAMA